MEKSADKNRPAKKAETFRERLGDGDIDINDYKVDDLRKIASEYDVSGSHGMHKEELVDAINKIRHSEQSAM